MGTGSAKARSAYIDLNDGSSCHDTKLGEHRGRRIFLDTDDVELESGLELSCEKRSETADYRQEEGKG